MVSSMVDDLESASAPIYPRKSLDNLNESIADTATTHNDDCSMSTAPSDYSSHGMPGATASSTFGSSNRASSKLMQDINLDEEENENDNSMGHVDLEDTTNDGCSVKTPDMNDTHHTLEQAEDIDSTGNLSEDSTDRPSSQPATPTAKPTNKKSAKRRTSGASTSSHSSSVARFTASPKRNTGATASLGTFHTRNTAATAAMNGSSTSFGSNKHMMMMNGSERSSASERSKNAMQRSPSRPTINCAPKRPTRFAAPRRAKSHSNLMVRSSSNRNLNTNSNSSGKSSTGNLTAKPAMLSPKRAKKGALGAMLDKNRKAAAGRDLLHAVNLLDHDKDDAASLSSNQSFQSRQSGFYPSDSITAEKIGQLATLDLSIGDHHHHDLGYNTSDNRTHHTAPLGRHSNHGFQRPSGVRRKPRSMSFDNSYNKYAKEARLEDLTIKWSSDTPLNTFVKNVNFLQSHLSIARLGKNFGVLGDLVTGKRELTMTTIDEDEDSEEFLEVHRQKQQEHHLATYLQNVSSESRDIALRGEMRNMSSISRKVALKGKTNLGSNSSSNGSNDGKGSERSARSWWGF